MAESARKRNEGKEEEVHKQRSEGEGRQGRQG